MMQLIYYLAYYLIEGIFKTNILGIMSHESSLDTIMYQIEQDTVCQTFVTFINHNLFLG